MDRGSLPIGRRRLGVGTDQPVEVPSLELVRVSTP
jgi:hypothetical protein